MTDPKSVRRGMGPDCWFKTGGQDLEKILDASPEEWAKREESLRRGNQDPSFGVAQWPYLGDDTMVGVMRVSVRYVAYTGYFEAFGVIYMPDGHPREIVFHQSKDIRAAYEAGVMAGPQAKARAYKAQRDSARAARRVA